MVPRIRQIINYFACVALMGTAFYFLRWIITGISEQFGQGFCCGVMLAVFLMWAVVRADPQAFIETKGRQ